MSPREHIRDLCRRYGVSAAFGDRLLPLAEHAEAADPEMRRRVHDFLERSFLAQVKIEAEEREAERALQAASAGAGELALAPDDLRALDAVASALHGWEPPLWLRRWAEHIRKVERPEGEPPAE